MPCVRCDNKIVENPDTGLCASCGADDRKAERTAIRDANKPAFKPIPKMSKKLAVETRKYSGKGGTREEHLKENPYCQIRLIGCENVATQVHHCAKRGKNLNNKETFKSACQHCHDKVEFVLSAKERRELGLLKT